MGARSGDVEVRAERAYRTILGRYEVVDGVEFGVVDLVTDLRHMCDQYAVEWDDVLRLVDLHYGAERVAS